MIGAVAFVAGVGISIGVMFFFPLPLGWNLPGQGGLDVLIDGWRQVRVPPQVVGIAHPAVVIPISSGFAAVALVLGFLACTPQRLQRTPPVTLKRIPYIVLGVLSLVSAAGIYLVFARTENMIQFNLASTMLGAAYLSFRARARARARSADEVAAAETRAPVLYLRSFASEQNVTKP